MFTIGTIQREVSPPKAVHQIPLDDALIVTADDFLLLALVLAPELGLEPLDVPDPDALPVTVTCPAISGKKETRKYDKPIFTTVHGQH